MSLLLLAAVAQLATSPSDPLPFPLVLVSEETVSSIDGVQASTRLFDLDDEVLAQLKGRTSATLVHCPLPSGDFVDLELTRLPITTEPTLLFVDGVETQRMIGEGITLWSGKIKDVEDSDVFFAFSQAGTRGWLRRLDEHHGQSLTHWIAERGPSGQWEDSRVRMVGQDVLGLPAAPVCKIEDLPSGGLITSAPFVPPQVPGSPAPHSQGPTMEPGQIAGTATPLRNLTIALETDHDFFQLFGSLPAAEAYAVSLMGAVSARYREQLDLVITLPYLGLYSTPADPWLSQDQGGSSLDVLYEFQGAWSSNMPADAALGHFLSGASLGGGIAFLDVLCLPEYRFGVSGNLAGSTPFPTIQGPLNWDFIVVSHEIGHNLGTLHTHDYCPPLDECAPSGYWGACQTSSNCVVNGTLMSYCHLCFDGVANITPYFHPTVIQTIAGRVQNSCLLPFEGIFNEPLAGGLSGSSGLPMVQPEYDASTHQLQVKFSNLPMPGTGFLIAGPTAINLPLLGALIVPSPNTVFTFPVNASVVNLPPVSFANLPLPTGLPLYIQGWFTDALSPNAYSATNAVLTEILVPNPPAPLTWFTHPTNGKQYALTAPGTWHKTEGVAIEHGGHLVSFANPAEDAWLQSTFFLSGLVSGPVYIGYTDEQFEGFFQWTSGAFLTFDDWNSGQPNNFGNGQDYTTWDGSTWRDEDGYENLPGLIQRQ
ncbi:MAG: hypothetical protein ACI8Q9_000096 [Planctomycetota bacterium]|jgi:hypothetical protein